MPPAHMPCNSSAKPEGMGKEGIARLTNPAAARRPISPEKPALAPGHVFAGALFLP